MKNLSLLPVTQVTHLIQPDDVSIIDLDSSALEVLTDFNKVQPLVIDVTTEASHAEELMIEEHVKLKLVVNAQDEFLGIITAADVSNDNIIRRVAQGLDRHDIRVRDLMHHRDTLFAVSYNELSQASVSDLIKTLEKNGLQHCLVTDLDGTAIRGLISASDVARKLRIKLSLHSPPNFAQIFDIVTESHHDLKNKRIA